MTCIRPQPRPQLISRLLHGLYHRFWPDLSDCEPLKFKLVAFHLLSLKLLRWDLEPDNDNSFKRRETGGDFGKSLFLSISLRSRSQTDMFAGRGEASAMSSLVLFPNWERQPVRRGLGDWRSEESKALLLIYKDELKATLSELDIEKTRHNFRFIFEASHNTEQAQWTPTQRTRLMMPVTAIQTHHR